MLDLDRLRRIRLTRYPGWQRFVGDVLLRINYEVPPGNVKINIEGWENLPDEPVIFAMNHPDRYNYFPFQYRLFKEKDRFTATWVKGKYYESQFVGTFMEKTNQLPTVSRGYLISRDFVTTLGRRPNEDEYAALRAWVNATSEAAVRGEAPKDTPDGRVPSSLLTQSRDILGRTFDPKRESYAQAINATFKLMMTEFVKLHEQVFDVGLDLLVFPQGTRSVTLSRGRIGMAQVALRNKKLVVPVGCNGSEKLYPSSRPWALPGEVTYRIGKPVPYGEIPDTTIDVPYEPFTAEAEAEHRETFQRYIDGVMDRINDLLDPEYRFGADDQSDGVEGTARFI